MDKREICLETDAQKPADRFDSAEKTKEKASDKAEKIRKLLAEDPDFFDSPNKIDPKITEKLRDLTDGQ